jgi:hypothetical protein
MKRLVMTLSLIVAALGLTLTAQGGERRVVVPKDNKPFKVGERDVVRLTGSGIAGSKVETTGQGNAKIEETNHHSERQDGHVVVGNSTKEFEIKPGGSAFRRNRHHEDEDHLPAIVRTPRAGSQVE